MRSIGALLFGLVVLCAPVVTHAANIVERIEAGSLVIPMDECYQYNNQYDVASSRAAPNCYCGNSSSDDGVLKAYGLVYKLLENGVTIYLAIDDTKTTMAGVDFGITGPEPVKKVTKTTGATTSFYTGSCSPAGTPKTINYRGAPFVIPAGGGNALRALQLMRDGSPGSGTPVRGAFSAATFDKVDVHLAQVPFDVKVSRRYNQPPRPLALLDIGGASLSVLTKYLASAGLNTAGSAGTACAPGAIYGIFSTDLDFLNNCLITGAYDVLWAPHWEGSGANLETVVAKIATFVDGGGGLFAECASIETFEGSWGLGNDALACGGKKGTLDIKGTLQGHFQMTNGSGKNWLGNYGTGAGQGFVFRDIHSPFVQMGDLQFEGIGGHIRNWRPAACPTMQQSPIGAVTIGGIAGDSVYHAGVSRLVSSCDGTDYNVATNSCKVAPTGLDALFLDSESNWDFYTYRRKDNDPAKGPIVYLGGHDFNGISGGVRMVLNTLLNMESEVFPQNPPIAREFARSSPIVAELSGALTYIQGTFIAYEPDNLLTTYTGASDNIKFKFPYRIGHLRAFSGDAVGAAPTDYPALGTPLWDADLSIPIPDKAGCVTQFNGTCRTVFTNTVGGLRPARVALSTANVTALKPLLAPTLVVTDVQTLIGLILAGHYNATDSRVARLGGIDRSTMALVGPSPTVGTVRPTMAYVGASDGMLHAICADAVAPCPVAGTELWAYIPRTQLPLLRLNTQRIDGSPKVADMYGDFDGDGKREWRTILSFQTGSGNAAVAAQAPAVITMDVTDPTNPIIVWEKSTPSTRTAFELGVGLGLAIGPIQIGGQLEPAIIVETNNGGTGGSGFYVNAFSAVNGASLWAAPFAKVHPAPRTGGNPAVPASGIPGGVSAVSLEESGFFDRILVPTLYGDLWAVDAKTGLSVYPTGPLFRFSKDFQPIGTPPAIYRDATNRNYYAVVTSGGYVDPTAATWTRDTDSHYAVSVRIDAPPGVVALNELGTNSSDRPFVVDLGVGQAAFAQATIAGGELFVVTSDDDVNVLAYATGNGQLHRVSLTTGERIGSPINLGSGAGASVDVANGVVYAAGTDKAVRVDLDDFDAVGISTELTFAAKAGRRLWLRLR